MLRELYSRLFRVSLPRQWYDIIIWWETRRAAYNLIMFLVGIIAGLFFTLGMMAVDPQGDFEPFLGVVVTIIGANLGYTLGWIVELFLRLIIGQDSPIWGPRLLKTGMVFSLVVLMMPGLVAIVAGIANLVK